METNTKRAAKALVSLSEADDKLNSIFLEIKNEDHLKVIHNAWQEIAEAKKKKN